jgi:hypothetical protein
MTASARTRISASLEEGQLSPTLDGHPIRTLPTCVTDLRRLESQPFYESAEPRGYVSMARIVKVQHHRLGECSGEGCEQR